MDILLILMLHGFILAIFIMVIYKMIKLRKLDNDKINLLEFKYKYYKKILNNAHLYVARDEDCGILCLYLNKPIRSEIFAHWINSEFSTFICADYNFEKIGLNKDDYKDLKWEDEPLEVSLH